jgi:hypothetical protein
VSWKANVELIRAYGAGSVEGLDIKSATLPCVPDDRESVTKFEYVNLRNAKPTTPQRHDPTRPRATSLCLRAIREMISRFRSGRRRESERQSDSDGPDAGAATVGSDWAPRHGYPGLTMYIPHTAGYQNLLFPVAYIVAERTAKFQNDWDK